MAGGEPALLFALFRFCQAADCNAHYLRESDSQPVFQKRENLPILIVWPKAEGGLAFHVFSVTQGEQFRQG